MHIIMARNVNDAYAAGMEYLNAHGALSIRNLKAAPHPVTTVYSSPTERVLFDAQRDADPFFHLFDALRMLSEQIDVDWNPIFDLNTEYRNIPGDDVIGLRIMDGRLYLQTYAQSNDIILDGYSANTIHLTMLLEYLALRFELDVGSYTQISGDYYARVAAPYTWEQYYPLAEQPRPYEEYTVFPLVHDVGSFREELQKIVGFIRDGSMFDRKLCGYRNLFLLYVVLPMFRAQRFYQEKRMSEALDTLAIANAMRPSVSPRLTFNARNDWVMAGFEWLLRHDHERP